VNQNKAGSSGAAEFDLGREIVVKRLLNAPRELVFEVWTDASHLSQWWGPDGFTTPLCEVDARPGGKIRIHMRGPDGTIYPMTGVFQEVVPPERLVFTTTPLDPNGHPLFETLNIVTFAEQDGKTAVTVQARATTWTAQAAPYLQGMEMGWTQTVERLAGYAESTHSERTAQ
jgi:uncharacterized protein YndB with AHSA1/START domain